MEKKPSLFSAANEVEAMMFAIDNAENLDEQIINDFKDLTAATSDAVNRCFFRLGSLDMFIDQAAKEVAESAAKLAKLKKAKEHMEKYILACVQSVSFPLKGECGEFTAKTNPGRVSFAFPVVDSKSFSNILPTIDTAPVSLAPHFLERVEFFRIRKDEVSKALKAGEEVPGATLLKEIKLCTNKTKSLL